MTMLKLITELAETTDKAVKEEKLEAIATIMFNEGVNLVALGVVVEEENENDGIIRFTYPEKYLDTVLTAGQLPETYLTSLLKNTIMDSLVYMLGVDMISRNDFDADLTERAAKDLYELIYKGIIGTPRPGEIWTMSDYYTTMNAHKDELKEYLEHIKGKVKFS